MVGRVGAPLNALKVIHIINQQGSARCSRGQWNWCLIQRIGKLNLHEAFSPDLIEQVAEGVELLGRKRMLLVEIPAGKAQELDPSRAQARDYLRVIAHKPLTAEVFGIRSKQRKNVAAKQIRAEREALIQVDTRLRLIRDLHGQGGSASVHVSSGQHSPNGKYACQDQQKGRPVCCASFGAPFEHARDRLNWIHCLSSSG